jgi:hypothetical protein
MNKGVFQMRIKTAMFDDVGDLLNSVSQAIQILQGLLYFRHRININVGYLYINSDYKWHALSRIVLKDEDNILILASPWGDVSSSSMQANLKLLRVVYHAKEYDNTTTTTQKKWNFMRFIICRICSNSRRHYCHF